jgi:hypothetical protein
MDKAEIIKYLDLTDKDLTQIENSGISWDSLSAQVDIFRNGVPFINIVRPCSLGDGIIKIKDDQFDYFIKLHEEASKEGRLIKFVPASGAATRMCKDLIFVYNSYSKVTPEILNKNSHLPEYKSVIKTFNNLKKFAFYGDLKKALNKDGHEIDKILTEGKYKIILDYILHERGLNLAEIPKGITKFHKYPNEERSSLEEHVIESIKYIQSIDGRTKIHFTISENNYEEVSKFIFGLSELYKERNNEIEIDLSSQKQSTNNISIYENSKVVRDDDGNIIFRPGGHGALLENLNDINGDIIFIKNIDNVVPESKLNDTIKFKKLLCGFLIDVQTKIFEFLEKVESKSVSIDDVENIISQLAEAINYKLPDNIKQQSPDVQINYLVNQLNRPIRVCGMVKNEGEPGGGPFWVKDSDGSFSCQIVESAQIDLSSEICSDIFQSSSHFNPVDLVCGVRDFKGRNFNLLKYRDLKTSILTSKSFKGRRIKVIELPGLWNGAMAKWFTIFIEVPLSTFNPVKKINDLLKPAHQV